MFVDGEVDEVEAISRFDHLSKDIEHEGNNLDDNARLIKPAIYKQKANMR